MHVPLIDLTAHQGDTDRATEAVDNALAQIGFMVVRKAGIDPTLLQSVYSASKAFFTGPKAAKNACRYLSAEENFGYQSLGQENLNPDAPADLKETFTMRNIINRPPADERWPSPEFRDLMQAFYTQALSAGEHLQRILCSALKLDGDYFARCHSGENISLRLLYYPATETDRIEPEQMGAGAHTDYGLLTLLFQDDVGGLQVMDNQQQWQDVAPVADGIVINSGDLLERWTNGRYRSTPHRVQARIGDRDRLSIAMFIDPDSNTQVEALASCVSAENPAKYPITTAGEHIQQKLDASHKNRYTQNPTT